jgi:hypothetical protein
VAHEFVTKGQVKVLTTLNNKGEFGTNLVVIGEVVSEDRGETGGN